MKSEKKCYFFLQYFIIFHQVSVLLANYITYQDNQYLQISVLLIFSQNAVFYHDFFLFQENSNIIYTNNLSITQRKYIICLLRIFSTTLEKFFLVPKIQCIQNPFKTLERNDVFYFNQIIQNNQ
ncbi:hypothetical protein pb186bvf_003286 [Paramecium bursaria]